MRQKSNMALWQLKIQENAVLNLALINFLYEASNVEPKPHSSSRRTHDTENQYSCESVLCMDFSCILLLFIIFPSSVMEIIARSCRIIQNPITLYWEECARMGEDECCSECLHQRWNRKPSSFPSSLKSDLMTCSWDDGTLKRVNRQWSIYLSFLFLSIYKWGQTTKNE